MPEWSLGVMWEERVARLQGQVARIFLLHPRSEDRHPERALPPLVTEDPGQTWGGGNVEGERGSRPRRLPWHRRERDSRPGRLSWYRREGGRRPGMLPLIPPQLDNHSAGRTGFVGMGRPTHARSETNDITNRLIPTATTTTDPS